jgi:hypothetical protein
MLTPYVDKIIVDISVNLDEIDQLPTRSSAFVV